MTSEAEWQQAVADQEKLTHAAQFQIDQMADRIAELEAERDAIFARTKERCEQPLFKIEDRGNGYRFMSVPEHPGFTAMLKPGESGPTDDHIRSLLMLVALDAVAAAAPPTHLGGAYCGNCDGTMGPLGRLTGEVYQLMVEAQTAKDDKAATLLNWCHEHICRARHEITREDFRTLPPKPKFAPPSPATSEMGGAMTLGEAERGEALEIAERWLDFKMNALVDMVPGDPDCAACVLARQYVRAMERLATPSLAPPTHLGGTWKRGDRVLISATINAPTNESEPTGKWWVQIDGHNHIVAIALDKAATSPSPREERDDVRE